MLFSIKKILVCTDLSEKANDILKNAEALRKRTQAEADILYVSDIGIHLNFTEKSRKTYYDEFLSNFSQDLEKKLKKQIEVSGIQGRLIYSEGNVADKINESVTGTKYDLLIMGHNSQSGILHHLLGSVARKILSSVAIPTLIIKQDLKFEKMGALVDCGSAIDWMITSSMDFYRSLKFQEMEFISLWHDYPQAVGDHQGKECREKLEEEVKYFSHENEKPLIRVEASKEFQVAQHLSDILEEDKIDLAVMKRNRGQKIKKMVLGSETMRMLEMDPLNLLILPV